MSYENLFRFYLGFLSLTAPQHSCALQRQTLQHQRSPHPLFKICFVKVDGQLWVRWLSRSGKIIKYIKSARQYGVPDFSYRSGDLVWFNVVISRCSYKDNYIIYYNIQHNIVAGNFFLILIILFFKHICCLFRIKVQLHH